MLPVVSKDILASYNVSNIEPVDVIRDIDRDNPVLSLVLATYCGQCDERTRAYVITGMALVYGLLAFQKEADELNEQFKN